jgi:hypothetical protein
MPDDICDCGYEMGDDGESYQRSPMYVVGGIIWQREDQALGESVIISSAQASVFALAAIEGLRPN